jgi:hypothetical protein
MGAPDLELSRISKLFVDRDQATPETALALRKQHAITLLCGEDVASSHTLQLAVLTAASIATRCFPGAVKVALGPKVAEAPLQLWPSLELTFGSALLDLLSPASLIDPGRQQNPAHAVIFGNAPPVSGALRVTFDGWIAKVGPAHAVPRLPEREFFSVAGILAAALAISELFLSFARISVEATRRTIGLSLWRPDLDINDPSALGLPVEYLPRELWLLGLGHLGNAYLWSLTTLPYHEPDAVEFVLNDFDHVEPENIETGVLFSSADVGRLKSRPSCEWVERRGFQTRLVERRFDGTFRRHYKEPGLALCGFDSNPARRDLATAEFLRVIESGLGNTASNFDAIGFHTLPNARTPAELWPDLTEDEEKKRTEHLERVARDNPAYSGLGKDLCGRYELAGKSVAVPFVGATAASLVVAEAVRLLHDGPAYADVKIRLGIPKEHSIRMNGNYTTDHAAGLKFVKSKRIST